MHAGAKGCGQSGVSGNDQHEAASAAESRQVMPKRHAAGFAVVTQHDAGETPRQPCHGRPRIGQAARIGE